MAVSPGCTQRYSPLKAPGPQLLYEVRQSLGCYTSHMINTIWPTDSLFLA